jgi:putative spermidine/putrescine transport system permease protein
MRVRIGFSTSILLLVLLYLLIPLGATLVFGLSGGKNINFGTYTAIFNDPDFYETFSLSLELSLSATVLTIILVTPTAYWVQTRLPQGRPIMDILTLVPFAVPAIVMALGLVETYGTPNVLISIHSFPVYLFANGQNAPYKAASLTILSFLLTLLCVLGMLLVVARRRPSGTEETANLGLVAVK